MRIKAIALALLVAGFGASYALAGNAHGKPGDSTSTATTASHGKGHGTACRPNVSFILNGTFVSAAADGSSFTMNVTHANHHAKGLGSPATITVAASTRIVRNGQVATLADLKAGDRLNVQARGCKSPPAGTVQTMVAKRVVAHPAASSGGSGTTTDQTTTTTG